MNLNLQRKMVVLGALSTLAWQCNYLTDCISEYDYLSDDQIKNLEYVVNVLIDSIVKYVPDLD